MDMATVGTVAGQDYSKYMSQIGAINENSVIGSDYDKLYNSIPCYNYPTTSAYNNGIQVN